MTTSTVRRASLCGCALTAMMLASAASAQDANGDAGISEVVVTGSRVIQNGFQAPTPVTVVTAEQLQKTAPSTLSDALNQLPSFRNSFVAASTGPGAISNAGGAYVNLRSLSAKRNLVLLDGKRIVSSNVSGSVGGATDLNVLPQALVQRVDVVTGGASAAYGSDAISGVVNFILDTKFTGLKGEVSGGIAQAGDNQSVKASLTFGQAFLNDRLHVIGSLDYYNSQGSPDFTNRDWALHGYANIRTLAALPQTSLTDPTRIIAPNVRPSNTSLAGLITSGPLAGYQFTPGGGVAPFPFGAYRTATTMSGGSTDPDLGVYLPNVPPLHRRNAFLRASYDLSPDWNVYAEGLYGQAQSVYHGYLQTQTYTIFADNAYLTPAIRAALPSPTGSFTFSRFGQDFGIHEERSLTDTLRFVGGVDGKFHGWTIKAYYEHGEAHTKIVDGNNAILTRLYDAVDAVVAPAGTPGVAAGSIVCRSTLTSPGNGCVPLNLFGPGAASPAAIAYTHADNVQMQKIQQDVADISISGSPFSLWAGPVSFGAGFTYRKEQAVATTDGIAPTYLPATPGTTAFKTGLTPVLTIRGFPTALQGAYGGFESSNLSPLSGSFDVKEVFGETLIPLARDLPFARSLDLNAAIRHADYSTSGGVTSWKVGVTYRPIDDLRLRTTVSRDIRAANLSELYSGVVVSTPALTDPFRNGETNTRAPTLSYGNTALKPEQGDTFTAGFVYQPSFAPGLSMSVDYYSIILTNAIGSLGSQSIVNQCYQGVTALCANIQRAAAGPGEAYGVITGVNNQTFNVGTNKATGIDIEASYHYDLNRLVQSWDGALSFRAIFNYAGKLTSFTKGGTSVTNAVGRIGQVIPSGSGGTPRWAGTFNVGYDRGPLSINVQERYIGSGVIDITVDENGNPLPANATVNPNPTGNGLPGNKIGAYFYTDLTASFKFGPNRRYEAFITVNNLMDKDPPIIPTYFVSGTLATNAQLYDTIGRTYTAGVRFRF